MDLHLSTVQYELNEKEQELVAKKVDKLEKLLGHIQEDIPTGNLVIHKHLIKTYLKKSGGHIKIGKIKKIDVVLSIHLMKASLHAIYEGRVAHIGLKEVFASIESQLQKYKQKHFSSFSDYPDHRSLRNTRY